MIRKCLSSIACILAIASGAHAQTPPEWLKEGWKEPQDTAMALFQPDEYAWRLFVSLNWPAEAGACTPDRKKKLGDGGEVVWERWALKSNVFLPKAAEPKPWSDQCAGAAAKTLVASAQTLAAGIEKAESADKGGAIPMLLPPKNEVSTAADEEVRMNQQSFDFIRTRRLYSRNVLEKMASQDVVTLDFPRAGKEIKAHWILLKNPAADRARYHTGVGPDGKEYGLVALHIITKDLPRWFWATFEHVDNETRHSKDMPAQFAGWTLRPRDAFACPTKADNCGKPPAGIGLEGTKWRNYVLKATQTDWVDLVGRPTRVVNSKIEGVFIQNKSSCISCHSLALIGEQPSDRESTPFHIVDRKIPAEDHGRIANFIGVVKPEDRVPKSNVDPNQKFMQLDFVFSLRNADRE